MKNIVFLNIIFLLHSIHLYFNYFIDIYGKVFILTVPNCNIYINYNYRLLLKFKINLF